MRPFADVGAADEARLASGEHDHARIRVSLRRDERLIELPFYFETDRVATLGAIDANDGDRGSGRSQLTTPAIPDPVAFISTSMSVDYRPLKTGGRFSTEARAASRASSVYMSFVLYPCSCS